MLVEILQSVIQPAGWCGQPCEIRHIHTSLSMKGKPGSFPWLLSRVILIVILTLFALLKIRAPNERLPPRSDLRARVTRLGFALHDALRYFDLISTRSLDASLAKSFP